MCKVVISQPATETKLEIHEKFNKFYILANSVYFIPTKILLVMTD